MLKLKERGGGGPPSADAAQAPLAQQRDVTCACALDNDWSGPRSRARTMNRHHLQIVSTVILVREVVAFLFV